VEGQADLLEVVGALRAPGGLADFLHRGQEQADEDGDDGDHNQQLDEREGATPQVHGGSSRRSSGPNGPDGENDWTTSGARTCGSWCVTIGRPTTKSRNRNCLAPLVALAARLALAGAQAGLPFCYHARMDERACPGCEALQRRVAEL